MAEKGTKRPADEVIEVAEDSDPKAAIADAKKLALSRILREVEDKPDEAEVVAAEASQAGDAKEEAITKASSAEVREWNPATGEMETKLVDLDVLRAEALAAL